MVCKVKSVATPAVANRGGIQPVRGARPTGVREELEEIHEEGPWAPWMRNTIRETPSWLVSMIFHMIVLLVLALWALPPAMFKPPPTIQAHTGVDEVDIVDLSDDPIVIPEEPVPVEFDRPDPLDVPALSMPTPDSPEPPSPDDGEEGGPAETDKLGGFELPDGLGERGHDSLGDARGIGKIGDYRTKGFNRRRGTPQGETVQDALKWLAAHQLADGSWSFDHTHAAGCGGKCSNTGKLAEARIGATAIALLPFLGAGQTHQEGKYKDVVARGLAFLGTQMKLDHTGGSFYEPGGRMYSHGLAAIALCEAYAMTHDKRLHLPAQAAINFTCSAQDPIGGGWRYQPREKGDTSAVGWQVMALKSAHMAYLRVPPITMKKVFAYLDTVQYESGAKYGYLKSGQGSSATTAIGLLCRMYLGWQRDNPALQRGVQWISDQGPAPGDMYYNYYASQVMRHWEGPLWKKWEERMVAQLLESQATNGHEKGSWYFKHRHSNSGGRIYCTAMAAMTLEVSYRVLPIYGPQSIEDALQE